LQLGFVEVVVYLIRLLLLFDIHISQGSVVTCVRSGGIFDHHFLEPTGHRRSTSVTVLAVKFVCANTDLVTYLLTYLLQMYL